MADPSAEEIAECVLRLTGERGAGKTICPSEVARCMAPDDWRQLMPVIRAEAARLADEGRVCVTQGGNAVDAIHATGPIRIGRP